MNGVDPIIYWMPGIMLDTMIYTISLIPVMFLIWYYDVSLWNSKQLMLLLAFLSLIFFLAALPFIFLLTKVFWFLSTTIVTFVFGILFGSKFILINLGVFLTFMTF